MNTNINLKLLFEYTMFLVKVFDSGGVAIEIFSTLAFMHWMNFVTIQVTGHTKTPLTARTCLL